MLTNIPGFLKRVTFFGGNVITRAIAYATNPGNGATSFCLISTHNATQFSLTSDPALIKDIDKFQYILNDEITKLGLNYDYEVDGPD